MKEIVFVLDESGAKGYSDNVESTPGELGVMAGYLIPSNCFSHWESLIRTGCPFRLYFSSKRGLILPEWLFQERNLK
ncbi:MAG: hypothetical protein WB444_09345 [Gallionella sp.]